MIDPNILEIGRALGSLRSEPALDATQRKAAIIKLAAQAREYMQAAGYDPEDIKKRMAAFLPETEEETT